MGTAASNNRDHSQQQTKQVRFNSNSENVDYSDTESETEPIMGQIRVAKKTLSMAVTTMMIAGTIAGSGILALPNAVESTGWIGFILIAYLTSTAAYTGLVLGQSWMLIQHRYADEVRTHIQDPYPMLGEKAFGRAGRYIVKASIYLSTFGGGVVFLLLASDIITNLIRTLGQSDFSLCYVVLILGAFFIPISWLGTPSDFWLLGVAALFSTAGACLLVTGYLLYLRFEHNEPIEHSKIDTEKFVISLGTIAFTLAGHPAFPTIQQDMTDRQNFGKSVALAFLIVLIMYLTITISSYILLGSLVGPNILTTIAAIEPGWPVTVSEILLLIHLLSGYLVVINPMQQDLEEIFKVSNRFSFGRVVIRTLLIGTIIFVAESIPRFAIVLSLVGGSAITMIIFILPVAMYEKLCRQSGEGLWGPVKIPLYRTAYHVEIVVIGVFLIVSSTYSAIKNITGPDTFVPPCYVNISAARV